MGDSTPQIHESLVATDDAAFELRAPASVVKPIFAYADALVDELKLHVATDGIAYEVVDPPNVAMCNLAVPAPAFETYDVAEATTVGINTSRMRDALRAGRQRQDDEIHLSYANRNLSTTVQREYDGTNMDLQTTIATIDPDSVRQEPDLPELELPASATIQRSMLRDAVDAVDAVSSHVRFTTTDGDLTISGEGNTDSASAVVGGVVDGGPADSIFSLDYLKGLNTMLAAVDTDEVTLKLGEEFPVIVEWSTEWNGAEANGKFLQAPRIQK